MKDELRRAARHPGWRAAIVATLFAVALTAMFGGFRTAKARRAYPEYGANATIDNGALALTPLRAWISDARPGSEPNPYVPPARYLVLQLRAENRTGSSLAANSYLQSDVVWLRQVPGDGEKAAAQQRSEGHDFGFELPPRLPVDVDLVWKLPPTRSCRRGGPGACWRANTSRKPTSPAKAVGAAGAAGQAGGRGRGPLRRGASR